MRAPDPLPPTVARDLEAMDAAVARRPYDDGDPHLVELALRVHELRPAPDVVAASRLDARVASALAQPQRGRSRRRAALAPALGLAACALLALVIGLATRGGGPGTSAGGGSTAAGGGGGVSAAGRAAPERLSGGSASTVTPTPPPSPAGRGADSRSRRLVERSATMRLGTSPDRVDAVAAGTARVATSLGGFVASSSVTSRRGATIDLRVPGARLDDAIARLSDLARVRDLERSTLDITARAVSVRTRLADARAERRGLLRQLAHAPTPRAADRIRTRLRAVSREIERARAAIRRVRDRASYASVGVEIAAEHRPAPAGGSGGWTPGDALHDAVRVLEVTASVLLVALAVLLPLGGLAGAAWLAARRLAQRRREQALDLA